MEKTKMKKKYVSPFMEELDFESEVHLLTISQGTKTTLQGMQTNTVFDGGSGARENDFSDFDEE